MAKMVRRVGLLLGLGLLAVTAYAVHRIGPRNVIGMLRYDQREEGDLRVGSTAPDVVLAGLDGRNVRLRDRIGGGKPVVLIFGSYM